VRITLAFLALGLLAGCPAPDLGTAPFLCNPGEPKCPNGYTCVTQAGAQRCVKEGAETPAPDMRVQPPPPDQAVAFDWPQLPDRAQTPDQPVVKWDGQSPPDLPPDQAFIRLCQDNAECKAKDPGNPCCCLLLAVWSCAPVCLDPLCLGI
jgi:hypothetical protein